MAEQLFKRAIASNDKVPPFHFHLGFALEAQGKWAEAETSYRNVLALSPDEPEALNNLGNVLTAAGRSAASSGPRRRHWRSKRASNGPRPPTGSSRSPPRSTMPRSAAFPLPGRCRC
jgi:tetratricopeptide (TPR) repeat protein